jgi:DNA-binding MarR family transcriptional regulator
VAKEATLSPAREAWQAMRELAHDPQCLDRVHRLVGDAGLTPGIGKAMAHLPLDGRPLTMRELATALRCDSSYVTSVVDALEEHGLAERQAHPTDRRVKVVSLTPAGEQLAGRVQAELASPPTCFANLSAEELDELRDLLAKLQGRWAASTRSAAPARI